MIGIVLVLFERKMGENYCFAFFHNLKLFHHIFLNKVQIALNNFIKNNLCDRFLHLEVEDQFKISFQSKNALHAIHTL
ncbi:hypothetical protein BpHYR1_037130 [Brachionus plicatilis]|uniref:Uncharacterized protein n=1 Tax=Brachionus plicatilis TaxID=10195 RepID=A0A3M7SY20_BRAPC|nr:hypothetical protein BpHYR1_037130 [Brachionus plicatilis]